MSDRRALAQGLLWFVVANLGLLFADGYGYILAAGGARWTAGWLFVHVALLAQLATAMLLVAGLVLALAAVPGGTRIAAVLAPVAATALQVLLYVDRGVYAHYRFHVGGLALELLWMRGGSRRSTSGPTIPACSPPGWRACSGSRRARSSGSTGALAYGPGRREPWHGAGRSRLALSAGSCCSRRGCTPRATSGRCATSRA